MGGGGIVAFAGSLWRFIFKTVRFLIIIFKEPVRVLLKLYGIMFAASNHKTKITYHRITTTII